MDNVTDLLAMDAGPARRPFIGDATPGSSPLFEGGWLYEGLIAEHRFSVLVTVERDGTAHRILFDAGLSPDALVTNMRRLGLDPGDVEIIVLSHGHPTTPPASTGSSAPWDGPASRCSSTPTSGTAAACSFPAATRMESACETCAYFRTGAEFLPILVRQRDHAQDHRQTDRAELFTKLVQEVEQAP